MLLTLGTMLAAAVVGLTAADMFTRLTMLAAVLGCIALRQTMHDPVVLGALTTVILGAVLGWGLDFYDRIWWYDDLAHFLFSLLSVMAIARLVLHRFTADPPAMMAIGLWLAWLGIGSLWEIGEWLADQAEGTNHSRGYLDTMTDMMLNAAGAAVGVVSHARIAARTCESPCLD